MKSPSEKFHELLDGFTEERLAAIDKKLDDPNHVPREVAWRDDPDPFGRDWDWLENPNRERVVAPSRRDAPQSIRISPRRRLLWIAGIAASIACVSAITWWGLRPRPFQEFRVAAWVGERLETDAGGVRIAAPAGDDEKAEEPLIRNIDRPRDAASPSSPGIYAPMRVQEQLAIPDVPETIPPGAISRPPSRPLVEHVRPGSLFYLEFTTASTPSPGSVVVLSLKDGAWRLLWEEMAITPAEGTCYFGPIKMGDVGARYFLVLADRTTTPLLNTVAAALPSRSDHDVDPDAMRARLSDALKKTGHTWFAVQSVETRPASIAPTPKKD